MKKLLIILPVLLMTFNSFSQGRSGKPTTTYYTVEQAEGKEFYLYQPYKKKYVTTYKANRKNYFKFVDNKADAKIWKFEKLNRTGKHGQTLYQIEDATGYLSIDCCSGTEAGIDVLGTKKDEAEFEKDTENTNNTYYIYMNDANKFLYLTSDNKLEATYGDWGGTKNWGAGGWFQFIAK